MSFLPFMPQPSRAQTPWQTPPEPIQSQFNRALLPVVAFSPDNRWLLELERSRLPEIEELTIPTLSLAGRQINPQNHTLAKEFFYTNFTIKPLEGGPPLGVDLPDHARIRNFRWSPQNNYLAFTLTQPHGLELWVVDIAQAKAKRLTDPILNGTDGNPCGWLTEELGLVCKVVPPNQPLPPQPSAVPQGPKIESHQGAAAPSRTFTNLLEDAHDEALFEHYFTSVLEHITLTGDRSPLTEPLLIRGATPSPDGQWILLETLHRPFSYQVPLSRFPKRATILDNRGQSRYVLADLPLNEAVLPQLDAVRPGRRWVSWRADRPATVYWVEAQDGGDAQMEVPFHDAVYQLSAPFGEKPQLLWKVGLRLQSIRWGTDQVAIGSEIWHNNRQQRLWKLDPSQPGANPELLYDRNYQDFYSDPGTPVTDQGPYGWSTLVFAPDGESIYLNGYGASPEGIYPFLDRWNLTTGTTERLWRTDDAHFAAVRKLLDKDAQRLITYRQSQQFPPNYYLHDRTTTETTPITTYTDPLPWYGGITRKVVRYSRADGLDLFATLYLPPGYDPQRDGPLPTLLWVYPEEHRSRETASQVTAVENLFTRPWRDSVLFLLSQGYAVLNNPSMPIVGEGDEEPNDTYIEQLNMSATAAVDYLVSQGISRPNQVAVGGHSYGAFTAVNLLAHTNLFRTAIARSGAYNRTLTPFGFQGEQRTFWQASDTYINMSPFTHADKINEPLLLIHGAEDENAGTYPVQSERLYEALKGLGSEVRWVELPAEGHSYQSRQAVGHVLWEMVGWLDRHLKPLPADY